MRDRSHDHLSDGKAAIHNDSNQVVPDNALAPTIIIHTGTLIVCTASSFPGICICNYTALVKADILSADRNVDQSADHGVDQSVEQSAEQGADQSVKQSADQSLPSVRSAEQLPAYLDIL